MVREGKHDRGGSTSRRGRPRCHVKKQEDADEKGVGVSNVVDGVVQPAKVVKGSEGMLLLKSAEEVKHEARAEHPQMKLMQAERGSSHKIRAAGEKLVRMTQAV